MLLNEPTPGPGHRPDSATDFTKAITNILDTYHQLKITISWIPPGKEKASQLSEEQKPTLPRPLTLTTTTRPSHWQHQENTIWFFAPYSTLSH
jgi:hypothetical protein